MNALVKSLIDNEVSFSPSLPSLPCNLTPSGKKRLHVCLLDYRSGLDNRLSKPTNLIESIVVIIDVQT